MVERPISSPSAVVVANLRAAECVVIDGSLVDRACKVVTRRRRRPSAKAVVTDSPVSGITLAVSPRGRSDQTPIDVQALQAGAPSCDRVVPVAIVVRGGRLHFMVSSIV